MSEAANSQAQAGRPQPRAALTSVIIVAANSGTGLADCVERVLASTAAVEVIVVDNASADGSVRQVELRWSGAARLRIVRNATNLGFGTACNRGAATANGDAFVFLNPDCEIAPDTIVRVRAGAADSSIGLLGVVMIDARGNVERASRRRDPTLRRALLTGSGLARLEPRWPALAGVYLPANAHLPEIERVDAVSGALMYVPRALFERLRGFDENYFLHAEDLDLCRRVRDAGLAVACLNRVTVVHRKGGSSRHRPVFVAWHKHRGLWRWFVKFDPAARHFAARVLVRTTIWAAFAVKIPFLLLSLARPVKN